jgi:hypothetical protein
VTYYLYRWYDPLTGRWPSREPLGENGDSNLYTFISNLPNCDYDILGLCSGSRKALLDAACKAKKASEKTGKEWCAAICCKDGKYTRTKWNKGTELSCMIPSCPPGEIKVRDLHSHPGVDGSPSPQDKNTHASDGNVEYWISTDAPFSKVDEEIWMIKYNKHGALGGWIYNCKTGEFRKRE